MAIHKVIRIHQYLDDWLVRAGSHQVCLQHTQELVQICQRLGWLVNLEKSELEPKQIFNFVGYQFDLKAGRVRPTPDRWQILPRENLRNPVSTGLSGPAVHVPDWSANSHRKASLSRPASHETHTVASQKQLESAGSTGEGHSGTQIPSPSFGVVVGRTQCTARSTTASIKTRTANLYRRVKRRVGCSPWPTYRKRFLVSTRKETAHKLSGAKGSLSSPKRVPRSLRPKLS